MRWFRDIFRKDSDSRLRVVGTWAEEAMADVPASPRDGVDVVTIHADGTMTFSKRYSSYEVVSTRLTYVVDGEALVAKHVGSDQTLEIPFSFPTESSLTLDMNGVMLYRRLEDATPLPQIGAALGRPAQPPIQSYNDVRFIVNGENAGMMTLGGSIDGTKFFADYQSYLHGEASIAFRVGSQVVTNEVILKGNEFEIRTDFRPLDIGAFVAEQKRRVSREMEEAHFVEKPTDVFYLPASELLRSPRALPEFNRQILTQEPEGERYFVSHRWLSPSHPDPEGEHTALLKAHAQAHPTASYWIDYSCLPQSRDSADQDLFNKTLSKIASIQAEASTVIIATPDYDERLWCHIEHLTALFFSQVYYTRGTTDGPKPIEYLGDYSPDRRAMLAQVQTLQEPEWERFKVTKQSDIPGVKYNYRFLSNLVKYQLLDSFSELRCSLPGHQVFTGFRHDPQRVFGIDHSRTMERLRRLFGDCEGDANTLLERGALLWLAKKLSSLRALDTYSIQDLRFSEHLVSSNEMVAWLALLLSAMKTLNFNAGPVVEMRKEYATIVLMSMFR